MAAAKSCIHTATLDVLFLSSSRPSLIVIQVMVPAQTAQVWIRLVRRPASLRRADDATLVQFLR